MSEEDPQRTQEWTAPPDELDTPGATAAQAESAAAAREAAAQADRTNAEARGAELRSELKETDARRAEEETAKAQEGVEAAEQEQEKLSRKERKAKEQAEQAEAEAAQAREHAAQADRLRRETAPAPAAASLSGASVMSPGLGSNTDPSSVASASGGAYRPPVGEPPEPSPLERPEVMAGIVFGGAFLLARILKRLVD